MAIQSIRCEICAEWFSWDYWHELSEHKHNRFQFQSMGKIYDMELKLSEKQELPLPEDDEESK